MHSFGQAGTMKEELIVRVLEILQEAGFIVSQRCEARSFDLAARRNELTLLAKIMRNIDGLNEEVARSIKRVAFYLLASPLVIGERSGASFLEDDVVYHRYGIPAVNPHTLHNYVVEGVEPYVFSATGGVYVTVDGHAMKAAREEKELSFGDLASKLGVSKRSISKYEEGSMGTTIEIALKLEEILDTILMAPLEFLKPEVEEPPAAVLTEGPEEAISRLERRILAMMEELGFAIFTTAYAPFCAVSFPESPAKAREESEKILTGISDYSEQMLRRARIVSSLSHVMQTRSVFVVNGRSKYVQIDNTVLIGKDELEHIRDQDEFTSVMDERAKIKCLLRS